MRERESVRICTHQMTHLHNEMAWCPLLLADYCVVLVCILEPFENYTQKTFTTANTLTHTHKNTIAYCWTMLLLYWIFVYTILCNRRNNRGTKVTHDLYKYKPMTWKAGAEQRRIIERTCESEWRSKWCAFSWFPSFVCVCIYNKIPIIFAAEPNTSH